MQSGVDRDAVDGAFRECFPQRLDALDVRTGRNADEELFAGEKDITTVDPCRWGAVVDHLATSMSRAGVMK